MSCSRSCGCYAIDLAAGQTRLEPSGLGVQLVHDECGGNSHLAPGREPADILSDPDLLSVIDFAEPVAVLLVAVLHFVRPEEHPAGIVAAFRDHIAPGSYLVISHGVSDGTSPQVVDKVTSAYSAASSPVTSRTASDVEAFFEGLDLIEPGVVDVTRWRPERRTRTQGLRVAAGVGRKASGLDEEAAATRRDIDGD
jgi:hypothetical protein